MNSHKISISPTAVPFGFSINDTGGHMSRSMMLPEITALVQAMPQEATPADYKAAILKDNILGKPTFSSRDKSLRHLVQLYGLDPQMALFRQLRKLATEDPASLPLMAMTCTFCRDAQLRQGFALIEKLKVGEVLSRERMEQHLEAGFPGRFSPAMKKSLAQNINTTWTVSGHLAGHSKKIRTLPMPRMAASVYAMFAGYLLGMRGEILLHSVFSRLVAADPTAIVAHLATGSARGWLRFRHAGGVTEIDYSAMLTTSELERSHVAH